MMPELKYVAMIALLIAAGAVSWIAGCVLTLAWMIVESTPGELWDATKAVTRHRATMKLALCVAVGSVAAVAGYVITKGWK